MSLDLFLHWLSSAPVAAAVRDDAYPYVRAIHVGGAGAMFGSLLLFDLCILGWRTANNGKEIHRLTMPLVWGGFFTAALGGFFLFIAQPQALWENDALRFKLALMALAGLNAFFFEWTFKRAATLKILQISAGLSITLWGGVILFSSLIPYWGS